MPQPGMIRTAEFVPALRRVLPAVARPSVAVANSAGPDSTCLLFLLRRLFPPHALLSLHVVHHLQPAAPDMAAVAADNARRLGIPHRTLHVPWGVPPFPPAPTAGPVERTARDARYALLFRAISRARVPLLALAHHADDQLETAIMRIARGSSLLGAAGMRPSRRWGMGSADALASFGHAGLDAFLLRPLLPFPKHRILATCRAHRLNFVDDPTNSEPHITARNAIRRALCDEPPFSLPLTLPATAPLSFHQLKRAASILQSIAPDSPTEHKRLHSAVITLAARARDIDHQVTSLLIDHSLPSPIGTFLLPPAKLRNIADPDIRSALILRVIRYVSFHPWGSLSADANRRKDNILHAVSAIWPPSDTQPSQIKSFTAGGGVLWTPAIFNPNRPLRVGNQCSNSARIRSDDLVCWLASRMPPFSKNPQQGAGSPAPLTIDLTQQLKAAIHSGSPTVPLQVLYDCRFLLRIDPLRMPTCVMSALQENDKTLSIKVLPFTQYYWPKIVLRRESHPDRVLAILQENDTADTTRPPSWISIRWVRPLDAT